MAHRRARTVHRGAQLRRAFQPLPYRGLGVPMDEVSGRANVRLVHRMDLPVRRHPDRGLGVRHAPDRAAPRAQPDVRLEPEHDPGKRRSEGGGHHHVGVDHDPEHLRREARGDREQHRSDLRDPRYGGVRRPPGGRAQQPRSRRHRRLRRDRRDLRTVPRRDVHEPVRDLRL